ncbi:MAG: bifunctional adenosylcobinamide kinase/adenosylcobinamide-phosphate guanylyltransferase [Alphaproteobacteria bacterium]|nr:bifunctional adenosylcobinamide kinase/adenosylcobinamide-phosphate guanylyltransferase [Alphaproteobacteria bacterium]
MSTAADHRALTTLVLGGARSGKSAHAERLVEAEGGALVYLATAEAGDGEMAERIARHKTRRGGRWRTIEAPLALTEALGEAAQPGSAVLVDCLTIWLSNLLLAGRDVEAEMAALVAALDDVSSPVVLVSNEVGLGIVPENALARAFRDHAGRLNQMVAQAADRVVLVTAGLPMTLKPARELEMSA